MDFLPPIKYVFLYRLVLNNQKECQRSHKRLGRTILVVLEQARELSCEASKSNNPTFRRTKRSPRKPGNNMFVNYPNPTVILDA